VTLLLAASLAFQVQVRDSPKDWKKIVTDHFDLYYPGDDLLPRAREFAAWFEEARQDLGRYSTVRIPRCSVFVFASYHDLTQSSFLANPPVSTLGLKWRGVRMAEHARRSGCHADVGDRAFALAEPERNRILIHCQGSDRQNRAFARHELVHQLQFEQLFSFRLPSFMVAFKDPLIPAWFWEGAAEWMAGNRDGRTQEYLRNLSRERLLGLSELFSADMLRESDAEAVYVEGAAFLDFLEHRFGEGTVAKLLAAYGDSLGLDSDAPLRAATGKSRTELEQEFRESLERQFQMDRSEPREADRRSDSRAYYRPESWGGRASPDGKHLAWVGNRDVWPDLYVDGKGVLGMGRGLEGRVISAPAWSPDGKRLAVI